MVSHEYCDFFLSWLKMGHIRNIPGNDVLGSFQSYIYSKAWVRFGEAYRSYFYLFLGLFTICHIQLILNRVLYRKCYLTYELMI